LKLGDNLGLDFFIIQCVLDFGASLYLDSEFENIICLVNQSLIPVRFKLKFDGYVTPVDSLLEAFDCAADVGVSIDEFSIVESLKLFRLLVREDDFSSECLGHEKILTESTRTTSQDFVRVSRDDGTKSEDEVVDHLLVQEEGGD
jgi:hypothetical protein